MFADPMTFPNALSLYPIVYIAIDKRRPARKSTGPGSCRGRRPGGDLVAAALVRNRRRWQAGVLRTRKPEFMQKSAAASLPTLSLRIDLDDEGRIGPGKIRLLENIRQFGSISAAGRAMDMSYKRAWDLVDEINRMC